jgi:hypothetical protein
MSGFLTPDARLRVFDELSVALPGAKLHTFLTGSTTQRLDTFTDAALTVPNGNPVIAAAGGLFPAIYLQPGLGYRFVLTNAADQQIWVVDPVLVPAPLTPLTLPLQGIGLDDFRLTLESGVPVSSTDQTAKTAIYCTPRTGTQIDLYDAAGVPTRFQSGQFFAALPASVSQLYSVFVLNNSGIPELDLTPWTNDTTPGPAAYSRSAVTGTRTKTGDLTRRFKGLVRTTTVTGQTEDSRTARYLWNENQRVERAMVRVEPTTGWAYSVNVIRQAHGDAANQLAFIIGSSDDLVEAEIMVSAFQATLAANLAVGVGLDSTTVFAGDQINQVLQLTADRAGSLRAAWSGQPAPGAHVLTWLECTSGTGVTSWYGTNPTFNLVTIAASVHGGIIGRLKG